MPGAPPAMDKPPLPIEIFIPPHVDGGNLSSSPSASPTEDENRGRRRHAPYTQSMLHRQLRANTFLRTGKWSLQTSGMRGAGMRGHGGQ